MTESSGVSITPKTFYALYDFYQKTVPPKGDGSLGNWDNLTGGDMTVSKIAYTVVSESGNAATKYLPGITTYTEVQLLRALDSTVGEVLDKFVKASNLDLNVRSNYSIVMIDGEGNAQAMWNLINTIPTKIDGFSFNAHTGDNYETFEITLQPEYIEIVFP